MPRQQWEQMIDALFAPQDTPGWEFTGSPQYWKDMDPNSSEWKDFWAAFVRTITPN